MYRNIILAFLIFLITGNLYAKKPIIKFGIANYPPYINMAKDGSVSGEMIDLINKHFKESFDIQYVRTPLIRAEQMLRSKRIDTHMGLFKNPKRLKEFTFSKNPMLKITPKFCKLSGDQNFSDKAKNLIITPEAIYWKGFAKKNFKEELYIISNISNYNARVKKMLLEKRAKFAIIPHTTTEMFTGSEFDCKNIDEGITLLHLIFRKDYEHIELINKNLKNKLN